MLNCILKPNGRKTAMAKGKKHKDEQPLHGKSAEPQDVRELPVVPSSTQQPAADEQATAPSDADPLARWRAAREMEEEMSEAFDEDRVTHQHGGTEPEAD